MNVTYIIGESTTELEKYTPDFSHQTGNYISDLINGYVPLGAITFDTAWSLISAVFSIVALIIAIILIVSGIRDSSMRRNEAPLPVNDEDPDIRKRARHSMNLRNKKKSRRLAAIIFGLLVPIVWIFVTDFSMPYVLIDRYTIIIAIILIIHLSILGSYRRIKLVKPVKQQANSDNKGQ